MTLAVQFAYLVGITMIACGVITLSIALPSWAATGTRNTTLWQGVMLFLGGWSVAMVVGYGFG